MSRLRTSEFLQETPGTPGYTKPLNLGHFREDSRLYKNFEPQRFDRGL